MGDIEGRDIFSADFLRQEQTMNDSETPSEIQEFFAGSTIFVTGGTGFIGKVLIEKLLRVCWRLKNIYLLIRPKKGKSIEQRFDELFEGDLFALLRKQNPDFRSKVILIDGDLVNDEVVASPEDREKLKQNVNVIFHCAATVRFDEKIRRAVSINIKATKYFLDMAREMKNLKAFIHVSTAYSNCPSMDINEKFYTPEYDYKKICALTEVLSDNILDKITPDLLQNYPNTYAFTKMIGEYVVKEYGKGLPIAVLRPSIIISTSTEPIKGWINNYYGPQGVVFAAAIGLLRTLHCDKNNIADLVPVDLVISAVLAAAWDIGRTKGDNLNLENLSNGQNAIDSNSNFDKEMSSSDEIPVYNFISSERNPITWGQFLYYNYTLGEGFYSDFQLWYSSLTLNKNYYADQLYRLFCHLVPAAIVDLVLVLRGKKPMLLQAYKKVHKFASVISYFCVRQWKFEEENVKSLLKKLSPRDRELFNFDISSITWELYFMVYIKGLRVYLANDVMKPEEEERKKAARLKMTHYAVVTVINLLLFYFLYTIYRFFFS